MRSGALLVVVLFALAGCGTCGGPGCGGRISSGDLYFTRYAGTPNVMKVHFDYSNGKFTLDKPKAIATLEGVDGLAFAPDGDLLVGGQGGTVHKVKVADGKFKDVKAGGGAWHVSIDPSGKKAWVTGIPGPVTEIPLAPFGDGIRHDLQGDDTSVTTIVFDGSGHAYYTSGGSGGYGNVGNIDLKTFTTKRRMENVPAAHGMAFDRFSGDLLLFGSNHITQVDPKTMKVVSDREIKASVTLDQGTVDGNGYVFIASNNGQLVFVDYSSSKRIGTSGSYVAVQVLASSLDDVAPLTGAGSVPCS